MKEGDFIFKKVSFGTRVLCSTAIVVGVSLSVVVALQEKTIKKIENQNQILNEVVTNQANELYDLQYIKETSAAEIFSLKRQIEKLQTIKIEGEAPEENVVITIDNGETVIEIANDNGEDEGEIIAEIEEVTNEKVVGQDMELPDLPSDRKVITHYEVYNIAGTPHNRLQQAAWTDELGCRRYGDYYIVGLGSAYANCIGETFEVELDTGFTFKIITGDMKADKDTDPTNRYAPIVNYRGIMSANILEFIVDKYVLSTAAYRWGGVDYYPQFKGNIIRMTYLGRDTSADWDTYY